MKIATASIVLFNLLGAAGVPPPSIQTSLRTEIGEGILDRPATKRPLHGRFLHLTDFHPDPFYEVYSSTAEEAACHRGQGPAGYYGAETSECDSPVSLVNKTMQWVEKHLRDKVDFVVWTGDSARHDNDEDFPRDAEQVIGWNEFMVTKMFEAFGKRNGDEDDDDPTNDYVVPIIPTFGNNDILPHNVMSAGPSSWTRTYDRVWRQFIPEAQRHQFERGGWFYVEVIPNKLAVFSLNTLYFFDKNAAVDGCALKTEPGFYQMEWLRIQLQFMRERGVKVILSGHVPPTREDAKTLWDESCWQKYTLWLRQYRDVIVTSIYGHFNYDHFILQDFEDLDEDTKKGRMHYFHSGKVENENGDDEVHMAVSDDYWTQLREDWSKIPEPPKWLNWPEDRATIPSRKKLNRKARKFLKKIGGSYAERYAASFVSASVVPNLYPTLRVFEYNITGLPGLEVENAILPAAQEQVPETGNDQLVGHEHKHKFVVPEPPSKSTPAGPAYSPQTLSLLRFTQYFANLTYINNDFRDIADDDSVGRQKWHEGKHKGKRPHDKSHEPHPRSFNYEILYDTQEDAVYNLTDLTMPNIIDLARRIGNFKSEHPDVNLIDESKSNQNLLDDRTEDNKRHQKSKKHHKKSDKKRRKQNEPWFTFMQRVFVETMDPEQLRDQFGN